MKIFNEFVAAKSFYDEVGGDKGLHWLLKYKITGYSMNVVDEYVGLRKKFRQYSRISVTLRVLTTALIMLAGLSLAIGVGYVLKTFFGDISAPRSALKFLVTIIPIVIAIGSVVTALIVEYNLRICLAELFDGYLGHHWTGRDFIKDVRLIDWRLEALRANGVEAINGDVPAHVVKIVEERLTDIANYVLKEGFCPQGMTPDNCKEALKIQLEIFQRFRIFHEGTTAGRFYELAKKKLAVEANREKAGTTVEM